MHEDVVNQQGSDLERMVLDVCLGMSRELGSLSDALRIDSSLVSSFAIDSLSRLELRSRLEARLGFTVDEELVFAADTPRQIAQGIRLGEERDALTQYVRDLDRRLRARSMSMPPSPPAPSAVIPALTVSEYLFAIWCWIVFIVGIVVAVFLVALTPGLSRRRAVTRRAARLLITLLGLDVVVSGLEQLPTGQPLVIASNHASYIDAIVLMAVLPPYLTPIAKQEFQEQMVMRGLLDLFGVIYVRRQVPADAVHGAIEAMRRVEQGEWPLFFPEGTFFAAPGLLPFRLGAFWVAAHAGVDVVPVSLQGTRTLLPDGVWLPRRCPIRVHIGKPLTPTGSDWEAALELREQTFAAIASMEERVVGSSQLTYDASRRS